MHTYVSTFMSGSPGWKPQPTTYDQGPPDRTPLEVCIQMSHTEGGQPLVSSPLLRCQLIGHRRHGCFLEAVRHAEAPQVPEDLRRIGGSEDVLKGTWSSIPPKSTGTSGPCFRGDS